MKKVIDKGRTEGIRLLLVGLIFLSIDLPAHSQMCEGSLGENLFTRGDFGKGTDLNIQTDPKIAPGYRYNRNGPPNDGEYTITRNMGAWPNLFGTWLGLSDNGPESNGYMMVVNASFEPGLFYEEIVDGLCDNTTFEFSADIINVVRAPVTDHIFPNVDFIINDEVVLTTGPIRQTERWNTYSFNYATVPGETSLKLSLRNNAPGGGGNDLALDNISFRACGPLGTINSLIGDTLCIESMPIDLFALQNGEAASPTNRYQWQRSADGNTWVDIPSTDNPSYLINETKPGTFWLRFVTAGSPENFSNPQCRFFSQATQSYIPQRTYDIFDTICGGNSLFIGNDIADKPGLYIQELTSQFGCDSIVMIHLDTARRQTLNSTLIPTNPLCFGEANGTIEAINTSGGYPPYSIVANEQKYTSTLAGSLSANVYDVRVEDRFECFYESEITLTDPEELTVEINAPSSLILGDDLNISLVTNGILSQIDWTDPLDEFDGQRSFQLLPLSDLTMQVSVTDENGCLAQYSQSLDLETDVDIYIPNAFSPNGDRINDRFVVSSRGKSLSHLSEFLIFDRWGSILYDVTKNNDDWSGVINNQDVTPGTYTYRLTAVLINGEEIKKQGSINLFR